MSSTPTVWMNGQLLAADQVRVSPFDLGLAVGWGAFETMPGYDGKIFGFSRHYQRLQQSAATMEIYVPAEELLAEAVSEVIEANKLETGRARIRVSLSGGDNSLFGGGEAKEAHGNVMINAVAVDDPAEQVTLMTSPFPHNERSGLSGCKTSSYGNNLMALRHAVSAGANEAVMLNTVGLLCECATANIFLVTDGCLKTPSLDAGCLPGVTRAVVIELAHENGFEITECDLTIADVDAADEIFLTSSTREVQSAVMMGEEQGTVGELTKLLAELYQARVRNEIES